MKKVLLLSALLFAAASFHACTDCPSQDETTSKWGKPLQVTTYTDVSATQVNEETIYSYDTEGRLTGYKKTRGSTGIRELMYDSKYSGNVHTYKTDSYEWIGGTLPVVFTHTDTYSDDTFTVITEAVKEGIEDDQGKWLDYKMTTSYEYKDGKLTGYHTEANQYGPWTTHVEYKTGLPSESDLPRESTEENTYYDVIYTNGAGNRTGYYSGVNSGLENWNFKYGNGYCTYYSSNKGASKPHLVRVVFYPDVF